MKPKDSGPDVDSVSHAAASCLEWADQLTASVAERMPREQPAGCVEACAYCCHLKVLVTPVEVIALAEHLRATCTPDRLAEVVRDVERAADELGLMTRDERADAKRPCPLLSDSRCIAYAARPLHCAGANAADPQSCRAAFEDPDAEIALGSYGPQLQVAEVLHASMSNASMDLSLDGRVLELTRGLRLALSDPGLAKRWVDGEPAFADAVDPEFLAAMRGG